MIRKLRREKLEVYYYENDKKIVGVHSKIWGDVSGIRGNVDLCEITESERKRGIAVEKLIITEDK